MCDYLFCEGFELSSATKPIVLTDEIIDFITNKQWQCRYILETHAHADHLSAAQYLKSKLSGITAIGSTIVDVQKVLALPDDTRLFMGHDYSYTCDISRCEFQDVRAIHDQDVSFY